MKKIFALLLAASWLFAGNITIDQLLERAEKENKVGLVFIESDNCPWCKRMKERTFTNKLVEKKIKEELVFGVFNSNDRSLPSQMRSRNTPTVQYVNGNGEVLLTVMGFEPAGPFLKQIEAAQAKLGK